MVISCLVAFLVNQLRFKDVQVVVKSLYPNDSNKDGHDLYFFNKKLIGELNV